MQQNNLQELFYLMHFCEPESFSDLEDFEKKVRWNLLLSAHMLCVLSVHIPHVIFYRSHPFVLCSLPLETTSLSKQPLS